MEQSRCEKGDDHEETLAHLAALAADYNALANNPDLSAEARRAAEEATRPFAEEHVRLTARKKAE